MFKIELTTSWPPKDDHSTQLNLVPSVNSLLQIFLSNVRTVYR